MGTNQMILVSKDFMLAGSDQLDTSDLEKLREDIDSVCLLNDIYQSTVKNERKRIDLEIQQNPIKAQQNNLRAFVFSQNHVFGKLDSYCDRIHKILEVYTAMERLGKVNSVKVDGTDQIYKKVEQTQGRIDMINYDMLDLKKNVEFEKDFNSFQDSIESIYVSIEELIDGWLLRVNRPLEMSLNVLEKFMRVFTPQELNLERKFKHLFQRFTKELENIKNVYEEEKRWPPMPKLFPQAAGRIAWANGLLARIVKPVER